jgi:hypothetical protein
MGYHEMTCTYEEAGGIPEELRPLIADTVELVLWKLGELNRPYCKHCPHTLFPAKPRPTANRTPPQLPSIPNLLDQSKS